MTISRKILSALCVGLFVVAVSGCTQEGPAERAGKQVDKAIDDASDAMERVGDKVEEATER